MRIVSTEDVLAWLSLDVLGLAYNPSNPNALTDVVAGFQNHHNIILAGDALEYFESIADICYLDEF